VKTLKFEPELRERLENAMDFRESDLSLSRVAIAMHFTSVQVRIMQWLKQSRAFDKFPFACV
jgi:hypothetical protein